MVKQEQPHVQAPRPFVIALTGGPCAGKTTLLEELKRRETLVQHQLLFVPEAATILMNRGLSSVRDVRAFQTEVMRLQLQLEGEALAQAATRNNPCAIICDRGTLDGTAIKLFNTHYEWSVRLDLASVAYDPDVTYKVRVRVRVEKDPAAKGEAFWAGVYDTPAKKGLGAISVKAEKCGDGYVWYDVCKWKPKDGQYFWLGPGRFKKNGGVSAIKSVWVDRVEISRVDSAVRAEVVTADLVVYGSSPAAVSAAVSPATRENSPNLQRSSVSLGSAR